MKTKHHGFSLVETCIAVTLIACAAVVAIIEGTALINESKSALAQANASTLNLAMSEYREYFARGFRPASPWSAESAEDVIAELQKPLTRGDTTVRVLRDGDVNLQVTLSLVAPRPRGNQQARGDEVDDYSPDAVWIPLR